MEGIQHLKEKQVLLLPHLVILAPIGFAFCRILMTMDLVRAGLSFIEYVMAGQNGTLLAIMPRIAARRGMVEIAQGREIKSTTKASDHCRGVSVGVQFQDCNI